MAINRMIDSNVRCSICGTKGVGNCDCWEDCSCGWVHEKGKPCRNPECPTRRREGGSRRC